MNDLSDWTSTEALAYSRIQPTNFFFNFIAVEMVQLNDDLNEYM